MKRGFMYCCDLAPGMAGFMTLYGLLLFRDCLRILFALTYSLFRQEYSRSYERYQPGDIGQRTIAQGCPLSELPKRPRYVLPNDYVL